MCVDAVLYRFGLFFFSFVKMYDVRDRVCLFFILEGRLSLLFEECTAQRVLLIVYKFRSIIYHVNVAVLRYFNKSVDE